jgi:hypothetical protein
MNDVRLPRDVKAVFNKLQSLGGTLSAHLLQDMVKLAGTFTIPVTLPPAQRVTGRIYLAGKSDLPVARVLNRIFPNLTLWSAAVFPSSRAVTRIARGGSAFGKYFRTSTLALDIGGVEKALAVEAARAGVPCIARSVSPDQSWLWPQLTVAASPSKTAAWLGRWMLTDQAAATEMCDVARSRLRSRRKIT